MKTLKGIGASSGISQGTIFLLEKRIRKIEEFSDLTVKEENARLVQAIEEFSKDTKHLIEKANEDGKAILNAHLMLARDEEFLNEINEEIAFGKTAEFSVEKVSKIYAEIFQSMENQYMRERATDLSDVKEGLLKKLLGERDCEYPKEKFILVAEDVFPSDVMSLDKNNLAAIVTKQGGLTSHSVILSRILGIPCVVGVEKDFERLTTGLEVIVDGENGEIFVQADDATKQKFEAKLSRQNEENFELITYKDKIAKTSCGRIVTVAANIGSVEDAFRAKNSGADGVGLFRSEFLFLSESQFPTEQAQFEAYKKVLQIFDDKKVVVRTLDLGSDKKAPYFDMGKEDNPAMGLRAIRFCLKNEEIFKTQLRALFRASAFGKLAIMFPMISKVSELERALEIVAKVKRELENEKVAMGQNVEIGMMIETPSAAILSDKFAKMVDFFSIGTNDLTQYTLAVDRTNFAVSDLYESGNEAVLRLVELTAANARKQGIWVGVCGESACDPKLLNFFLDVGIDELSMSAGEICKVKKAILEK